jgi:hypothetical protein
MAPIECTAPQGGHSVQCAVLDCIKHTIPSMWLLRDEGDDVMFTTPCSVTLSRDGVGYDGRWMERYQRAERELGFDGAVFAGRVRACIAFRHIWLHTISHHYNDTAAELWQQGFPRADDLPGRAGSARAGPTFDNSPGPTTHHSTEVAESELQMLMKTRHVGPSHIELVFAGHDMHDARLVWFPEIESIALHSLAKQVGAKQMHQRFKKIVVAHSDADDWAQARYEWIKVDIIPAKLGAADGAGANEAADEDADEAADEGDSEGAKGDGGKAGIFRCQCSNAINFRYAMVHRDDRRILAPIGSSCIQHVGGSGHHDELPVEERNHALLASLEVAQRRLKGGERRCSVCHQDLPKRAQKCPTHYRDEECSGRNCAKRAWFTKEECTGKGKKPKDRRCEACRTCGCGEVLARGEKKCHHRMECRVCGIAGYFSRGLSLPRYYMCADHRTCEVCAVTWGVMEEGCQVHALKLTCMRQGMDGCSTGVLWLARGQPMPDDYFPDGWRCGDCRRRCVQPGCKRTPKQRWDGTYFETCYSCGNKKSKR